MMRKVCFATTNKGKLKEARAILGLEVIGTPLDIDEIQSMDPLNVARKKAKDYYNALGKPIFVEDVSLSIKALNGLPGTFISFFLESLGNEGIVKLLRGVNDRSATAQTTVVFIPKKGVEEIFIGKVRGEISEKPKGGGFGWDPIFTPLGAKKTFGQMSLKEKNKFSMRAKAYNKFKRWLDNSKIS